MSTQVHSRCLSCNDVSEDDCVYTPLGTDVLCDLIEQGEAVRRIMAAPRSGLLEVRPMYSGSCDIEFYATHAGHRLEVVTEYGEVQALYDQGQLQKVSQEREASSDARRL